MTELEKEVVDGVVTEVVADDVVVDDIVVDDVVVDDVVDDDADDDDDDKTPVVEPWMAEGDEDDEQQLSDVPVGTHIRVKRKLKGKVSERDDEIQRLKDEMAVLKTGAFTPTTGTELPKRPREADFDTIQEYEVSLAKYDDDMLNVRLTAANRRNQLENTQKAAKVMIEKAVDDHYTKAAKLITDNSIDTEVYKAADLKVRETIEAVKPKQGDTIADYLISVIGEGSEKVFYFLGRNKKALGRFESLLREDPSGLKASMFLGQQRERLLNSNKQRTSKAPAPAGSVKGDNVSGSPKASALLKKRKAALKKDNIQLAYDIKKEAKASGIDVSAW